MTRRALFLTFVIAPLVAAKRQTIRWVGSSRSSLCFFSQGPHADDLVIDDTGPCVCGMPSACSLPLIARDDKSEDEVAHSSRLGSTVHEVWITKP